MILQVFLMISQKIQKTSTKWFVSAFLELFKEHFCRVLMPNFDDFRCFWFVTFLKCSCLFFPFLIFPHFPLFQPNTSGAPKYRAIYTHQADFAARSRTPLGSQSHPHNPQNGCHRLGFCFLGTLRGAPGSILEPPRLIWEAPGSILEPPGTIFRKI